MLDETETPNLIHFIKIRQELRYVRQNTVGVIIRVGHSKIFNTKVNQ